MVFGLNFSINASDVQSYHDPNEISGWVWYDQLHAGDIFTWNLTEYSENGIPILDPSVDSLSLKHGSIIKVTITQELRDLDYLTMLKLQNEDLPFSIEIDGDVKKEIGSLAIEFIFPNMVLWSNGSRSNIFYLNTPKYNHELWFSPNGYNTETEYIINITDSNFNKIIRRDLQTGLLNQWHINYLGTVLTYERINNQVNLDDFQKQKNTYFKMVSKMDLLYVIIIAVISIVFTIRLKFR